MELKAKQRLLQKNDVQARCAPDKVQVQAAEPWVSKVKSLLKLAVGDGLLSSSPSNNDNAASFQLKPYMYLDPILLINLHRIFKANGLALVIKPKANTLVVEIGPEDQKEDETGAPI